MNKLLILSVSLALMGCAKVMDNTETLSLPTTATETKTVVEKISSIEREEPWVTDENSNRILSDPANMIPSDLRE